MKKIIGTNTIGYNQKRNFVNLPFEKYQFEKKQNLNKIPAYLYAKLTKKTHQYYWNAYKDFDLQNVELFHFFNAISYGKTPWITTFETSIPRWGNKKSLEGLKLIDSKSCKKIIAMSSCSANIQKKFIQNNFPEFSDMIDEKLIVLHPPQKCPPLKSINKNFEDRLIFTIVGSDFFRKGGMEILIAFDRLFKKGITDWQLNIVSKMQYGDYASKTTTRDLEKAYKIISKYPNHIVHEYSLPNSKVLELFKKTHVGLLPTYADTFGYSVLEAQSYCCPVISTDIRALPEINNSDIGWVINVKKNELGNAILDTEKSRANFSNVLFNGLEKVLTEIFNDSTIIKNMGIECYRRVENSIELNTRTLEKIYDKITTSNNT